MTKQTKKTDEAIITKMYADLEKLELKRDEYSEKLTETNQKIKEQTSKIKSYEEKTKMQLLTQILGDSLTVAELRVLAEAAASVGGIMKNIANVSDIPKVVQDISEFCELETQNTVEPAVEEG